MDWVWLMHLLTTLMTVAVTILPSACGNFTGYQMLLEVLSVP